MHIYKLCMAVHHFPFSYVQRAVDFRCDTLAVNPFPFESRQHKNFKMFRFTIYLVVVLFIVNDTYGRSISMQTEATVLPSSADEQREQFDDVLKRDKKSLLSTSFVRSLNLL